MGAFFVFFCDLERKNIDLKFQLFFNVFQLRNEATKILIAGNNTNNTKKNKEIVKTSRKTLEIF